MCNPICGVCKETEADMVYICKKCLDKLQEDQSFLWSLVSAGVDNWEGYENAIDECS